MRTGVGVVRFCGGLVADFGARLGVARDFAEAIKSAKDKLRVGGEFVGSV
jgi:hypothetical protein